MSKPPSWIRAKAYEAKWGRWRSALKAFLHKVDADIASSPNNEGTLPNKELSVSGKPRINRRSRPAFDNVKRRDNISIGLRYDVLRRDRFHCVICGANPATRIGCELHVDHKIPMSRGGHTVIDNLRTLCNVCNVGKGAKLEEDDANIRVHSDAPEGGA
jgi:hypothetical protein